MPNCARRMRSAGHVQVENASSLLARKASQASAVGREGALVAGRLGPEDRRRSLRPAPIPCPVTPLGQEALLLSEALLSLITFRLASALGYRCLRRHYPGDPTRGCLQPPHARRHGTLDRAP